MKKIIFVLGGLLTTVISVALFSAFYYLTGINLHSISIWFILPIGSILAGCIAASGYFFSGRLLNIKVNRTILFIMLFTSSLAHLLIYYSEYLIFLNTPGAYNKIDFISYVNVSLTTSQYWIGFIVNNQEIASGQIGFYSYILEGIHLIGFLASGGAIYISLRNHLFCDACKKYLLPYSKKKITSFNNYKNAYAYSLAVPKNIANEKDFEALLANNAHSNSIKDNSYAISLQLTCCPSCQKQLLSIDGSLHSGNLQKNLFEIKANIDVPHSINLKKFF